MGQKLDDITAPPWPPLSGVVVTAQWQVEEVERVGERCHHARAAVLSLLGSDAPTMTTDPRVHQELVIRHER